MLKAIPAACFWLAVASYLSLYPLVLLTYVIVYSPSTASTSTTNNQPTTNQTIDFFAFECSLCLKRAGLICAHSDRTSTVYLNIPLTAALTSHSLSHPRPVVLLARAKGWSSHATVATFLVWCSSLAFVSLQLEGGSWQWASYCVFLVGFPNILRMPHKARARNTVPGDGGLLMIRATVMTVPCNPLHPCHCSRRVAALRAVT